MILNVHRTNTPNCGDIASGPLRYVSGRSKSTFLDLLRCSGEDASATTLLDSAELIVLGGGGLLDHQKFEPHIRFLTDKYRDKLVVWGPGTNFRPKEPAQTDLSGIELVGTRDYDPEQPERWVPCASCLHPLLPALIKKRPQLLTPGIALLENDSGTPVKTIDSCGRTDIRRFGNKNVTFQEMVEFIVSAEVLVTNSYHGVYWATLCGVPVVMIPSSRKFLTLKHPAPRGRAVEWLDALSSVRVYEGALQECIDANLAFMRRVNEARPSAGFTWNPQAPPVSSPESKVSATLRRAASKVAKWLRS